VRRPGIELGAEGETSVERGGSGHQVSLTSGPRAN
jgi:hypothetical protein